VHILFLKSRELSFLKSWSLTEQRMLSVRLERSRSFKKCNRWILLLACFLPTGHKPLIKDLPELLRNKLLVDLGATQVDSGVNR